MWTSLFVSGLLATAQTPLEKLAIPVAPVSVVQAPAAPKSAAPMAPLAPGQQPMTEEKKEEEKQEEEAQKFFLMKLLEGRSGGEFLDKSGITIKGYADMNYTASTAKGSNLPMAMNYKANQFLLEQNSIIIEKAVDTEAKERTWGFTLMGLLPGSDYRFTVQNNLMDSQLTDNNGQPNTYGVDAPQFYVETYNPNLLKGVDTKVGRFYTILFNESIDPTQNKLVSRALTFMNNPFTHTGVLTASKLDDRWTMYNGLTCGADVFFGPSGKASYLGGLKWESEDAGTNFSLNTQLTDPSFNQTQGTANTFDVFEIQFNHKINDKWSVTSDTMYSFINNWDSDAFGSKIIDRDEARPISYKGWANWYGFVNYLTYNVTDKLSTTSRVEFFTDTEGVKTGYTGLYTTLTQGATYKMYDEQLWVRPEFRYDNNSISKAYNNDGTPSNGLFTFAIDVILRY